ncbi:outer membrane protein transport protein [Myxococcota bacterium]|nr:outer membrane protein transport protein [Myxococcota bacterium]
MTRIQPAVRQSPASCRPPEVPAKGRRKIPLLQAFLLLFALLFASPAAADPFGPRFVGGLDPGIPTHVANTGIYTNPAVIGRLKTNTAVFHFSPMFQTLDIDRATIDSSTGLPDPAGDMAFPNVNITHNLLDFYVGFTTNFGMDRITLGLAFFAPQRQELHTKHPALRYHLVDRSIANYFLTPALSVKLHRKFHAGFGLSYAFSTFDITMTRDRYLRGDLPDTAPQHYEAGGDNDEKVHAAGTDNNFGFHFGFLWQLDKFIFLAGSYRSKIRALDYTQIKADGSGSISRVTTEDGPITLSGNAKLVTTFPDTANLGIVRRFSRDWWFDATITWTRWGAHKNWKYYLSGRELANSNLTNWDLNITEYRGFQDTFSPQMTAFYRPTTGFEAIISLRYGPPAVPEKWVNASAVDNHAIEALFSVSYQITDFLTARLGYALEYMIPLNVNESGYDPSAAQACLDSHIDVVWSEACRATYGGRALPTAAGEYRKVTHQIGLGLEFKF